MEERGDGSDCRWVWVSFEGDENILKLDCGDDCPTPRICKNYQIMLFKQLNCMMCDLHLNSAVYKNSARWRSVRWLRG